MQSLSTQSPKRLGIRMANVQSQATFWATIQSYGILVHTQYIVTL